MLRPMFRPIGLAVMLGGCFPGVAPAAPAPQQAPVRAPVGVQAYFLDGVFGNMSGARVPVRDLPMPQGLRGRGVHPPEQLPGFRQRIDLRDAPELLLFQTLYGNRTVQRPLRLSLQDYLVRVRAEQSRRLMLAAFRTSRQQTGEEQAGRGLLEFEIPITVPRGLEGVVGTGGAGLTVSGNRRIRFAGRSEWTEGAVSTAAAYQTRFPALNMEQDSQFRIMGNIGSKLLVSIDQDSRALTDLENRINISYRGYEDEILQELVAGNTEFSIPGSQFLGFNQGARGLFGIKGRAQFGRLNVIGVATQEKGAGEKATFRAGARESMIRRPDIEPLLGTYYFLDVRYRQNWQDNPGLAAAPADSIVSVRVFIDDQDYRNDVEKGALPDTRAHFNPAQPQPDDHRETHRGSFHELDPAEYHINRALGVLALNLSLGPKDVLGVVYTTLGGEQFGTLPTGAGTDTLLTLKLIKASDQRPEDPTWDLEMRNVYYLGSRSIPAEGFEVKIYFRPPSGQQEYVYQGKDYLTLLGLDQWGERPGTPPDGVIDLNANFINLARGELLFPDLEPFNSPVLGDESRRVDMYHTIDRLQLTQQSRYYLEIKSATRAASYTLPAMNILEGSEVVTLNGRRLRRGTDYQLNYLTGELRFLTDEIQDPTADVSVDYEYSPLIQLEQRTLVGVRTEYDLGRTGMISAMLLSRNERTLDHRVRLGREPNRNVVMGANTSLNWESNWMTRLLDRLPLLNTEAPSRVQFEAEIAHSMPNPNTRGEALIDDFEAVKDGTSLPVLRGRWTQAAAPVGKTNPERARMVWYNPFERVPSRFIWPDKDVDIRSSHVNVLSIHLLPQQPSPWPAGAYQWDTVPLAERWGGVQQAIPAGAADLSRLSFIEIWVNANRGQLRIDLGAISEDVSGTGVLLTEDRLVNGVRNGVLDVGEDTGLNLMSDEEELDDYIRHAGQDPAGLSVEQKRSLFTQLYNHPGWYGYRTADDPAHDNWDYSNPRNYARINGTQGNRHDPDRLGLPDTEDINGNGYLDLNNDYFSFVLDLSPDSPDTAYVAGGDRSRNQWDQDLTSWRLYRIPLSDVADQTGSPDFSLIENVRLWVTGLTDSSETKVSIASLEFVGNTWRRSPLVDDEGDPLPPEMVQVSVVNTLDNRDEYEPPPGVVVTRDRVTNLLHPEQSLAILFDQLPAGVEGEVFSTRTRPENFTVYQRLALFLNGRPAGGWVADADTSHIEAFLRFGADANNFYEYRTRVYPGWDSRNHVDVDFEEITALKEILLADWGARSGIPDTTVGRYRVRGRPSLTNIRRLAIGVRNRHDWMPIDGALWADELRVTGVRRDPGTASRMALRTEFSDLGVIDFRTVRTTADFHGLRDRRGSQTTSTTSTLSMRADMDRFTPLGWGLRMPLTFNLRRNESLPKYLPGSDMLLDTAGSRTHRTMMTDESVSFSLRKGEASRQRWVSWTLDRIQTSITASRRSGLSPLHPINRSYQLRGQLSWNLWNLARPTTRQWFLFRSLPFMPEVLRETPLNPVPTELQYELTTNQIGEQLADPTGTLSRRYTYTATENYRLGLHPFQPVRSTYTLTLNRDLAERGGPARGNLGREVGRRQLTDLIYEPGTIPWLTQRYQFVADYRESNDPRVNTRLVREADEVRQVSMGRDAVLSTNVRANYSFMPSRVLGNPTPQEGLEGWSRVWNDLRRLGQRFTPVVVTLSDQNLSNQFSLAGRPNLGYRFGLSRSPGVTQTASAATQQSLSRIIRRATINSMVLLPHQAQLDLRPNWQWTDQISSSKSTFSQSRVWPAMSLRWGGLQQLWIFPELARSIAVASGYEATRERVDWINDAAGGSREPFSRRSEKAYRPLLSFQAALMNGMGISLMVNSVASRTVQRSVTTSESRTDRSDIRLEVDYQFSAPQGLAIPLLGRIRFESQLRMSLEIARSQQEMKVRLFDASRNRWAGFTPTASQSSWSLRPMLRYDFSRMVYGGFDMTWENIHDRLMRRTRKVREVALFMNLAFQ